MTYAFIGSECLTCLIQLIKGSSLEAGGRSAWLGLSRYCLHSILRCDTTLMKYLGYFRHPVSYLCQFTLASDLQIPYTQTNPRCREIQLFECLQFVECMRGSDVVILMGDFNTKPRHLAYSLLTKCMGLHDVFEKDPVDTCDLVSNIYTKKWMTPKRIDYMFYSDEFAANHSLILKVSHLYVSALL